MPMTRRFKNRIIPRGILIDRGYCFVRLYPNGRQFLMCIGAVSEPGVIDRAIAKLNEYREQIRLGKLNLDEEAMRLTIEQAAGIYWDLHLSKKKASKSYEIFLRYIKDFLRGRYVDTVTYVDVQNYRQERLKHVSVSSVNKEHAIVTGLFNKLKEWKRLKVIKNILLPDENPGSLVRKEDESRFYRKRVLTPEEFAHFIQVATVQVRRICLAAIHTTLRLKDLKALTRGNVNEATNQLEGIQAKTGKPYAIPINGVVRELIDTAPGQYILNFRNFRKQFETAVAQAGLKDFQFRDLRRTGARMMLKKGVDLATVASYLGHTSVRMTQAYVPPSHDDRRIAAEILGSSYRFKSTPNYRKIYRKDASQPSVVRIGNEAKVR